MACEIIAHFIGSRLKKSDVIGTAYRVFKNNILFREGRNAFWGMTPQTENYASFNELLMCIIDEQKKGNIPKGSSIILVGDKDTLDSIQSKEFPKGIQHNILKIIGIRLSILEKNNSFEYKRITTELSYCGTEIPQYLSKVAELSRLELQKFRGKIKNIDDILNIMEVQNQLGIKMPLNFEIYSTKDNSPILNRSDFFKYTIVISSHCLQRWSERVFPVSTKEEIIKYILESSFINGGIKHKCESFYLIRNNIVCVVIFKKNQIHFLTTYGTVNKTPALSNISYIKEIISKYGKLNLN